MVIAIASLFAASGITSSSIFAQSNGEDDETGTNNYEEFVNCLAQSEGDKGYASESEIRDCFRPIYDPEADTSSASSGNADDSNTNADDGNTNADDSNDIAPNTNTDSNN
jgi:hypothetical protein